MGDTSNGATDSYGDGCEWYAENKDYCGDEYENFSPKNMCCACGGGSSSGNDDPSPEPTPQPTPEPTQCQDTSNGATDDYGDGCEWYAENTDWCTDVYQGFNPSEMCCACGGGSN